MSVTLVAPRGGTWIEPIANHFLALVSNCVVPMRERELKTDYMNHQNLIKGVAPRVGAWIETVQKWFIC